MSIEDRLRSWGEEQRRSTTAHPAPVEHFTQSTGRRSAVIAAAAAVLVVAAVTAVVDLRRPSPARHVHTPAASSGLNASLAPAPTPPPGMQSITFHGLTIQVPAAWPLNATQCGTPVTDTVVIGDGATTACLLWPTPRVTSALFSSFHGSFSISGAPRTPITVGSTAAVRLDRSANGLASTEIVVPSMKVDLLLRSPNRATIEALIHTLNLTSTDTHGCPSQSPRVDLAPTTTSAGGALIPSNPLSVTVCRYLAEFLEEGHPVARTALSRFISVINALPAGLSVANAKNYSPTLCHGASAQVDYADEEEYVIRVQFSGGQTRELHARLALCGDLGISDGKRNRQRTQTLCTLLTTLAGNASGWPSVVKSAK